MRLCDQKQMWIKCYNTEKLLFREKTCKTSHEATLSCLLGGITPRFCSATENKTTEVPLRGGFVLVVFPNLCVNRLMTERYLVITQLTEKLAAAENLEGKG